MTQANERHLTPKPLREHVPGAWNFIEPNPNAIDASMLEGTIFTGGQAISTTIPRLTLSPEAREELLDALANDDYLLREDLAEGANWERVEDALMDILMPVRYVTGIAQSEPWLSDPHAP